MYPGCFFIHWASFSHALMSSSESSLRQKNRKRPGAAAMVAVAQPWPRGDCEEIHQDNGGYIFIKLAIDRAVFVKRFECDHVAVSGLCFYSRRSNHAPQSMAKSSARWKVLGAVALSESPLSVAQVSRKMGQARQSVQRIADSMANKGYFTWEENPAHKRAKLLKLTSKGESTFERLDALQTPWANRAARSLTLDRIKTAIGVLEEVADHFKE